MITVLVTGSNGQLGNEIGKASVLYPYYNFLLTDIPELDITDESKVMQFFSDQDIDIVINCAGYTAVDLAEDEPELALKINRVGVENLVRACKQHNAYLVHISTDFVFDGTKKQPYREDDKPNPLSSYGRSKLAGEEAMQSCTTNGMIVRTSWLYSSFGKNFVKTILKKGGEKGNLDVVDDQLGSPTYGRDLAEAILKILPKALAEPKFDIYHYSNEGEISWYEFAEAALEMARVPCKINPVSSLQYPQKASRPKYSVMDCTKIKERFGITIPGWKESLEDCINILT